MFGILGLIGCILSWLVTGHLLDRFREYQLDVKVLRAIPRWHRWSSIIMFLIGPFIVLGCILAGNVGFFRGVAIGAIYYGLGSVTLSAIRFFHGYNSFKELYFDAKRQTEDVSSLY